MEAYRDVILNLLNEFDQRFKDIESLEKDFAFFSAPFTINLKIMNEELQMEFLDLQIPYSMRNTGSVSVLRLPA